MNAARKLEESTGPSLGVLAPSKISEPAEERYLPKAFSQSKKITFGGASDLTDHGKEFVRSSPRGDMGPQPRKTSSSEFDELKSPTMGGTAIPKLTYSEEEYDSLITEYKLLTRKKLSEGLERRERCRLATVQWQLDIMEATQNAQAISELEMLVSAHEMLAGRIDHFVTELHGKAAGGAVVRAPQKR